MIRPKKQLGQNFLNSKKIVERIVSASQPQETDVLLEIGPGKGILTQALLETKKPVIAIEKDTELIPYLTKKFEQEITAKQLLLIEGDILTTDISTLIHKEQTYKVVANIPYYITGEILRTFLEMPQRPSSMTLLLQKEVAQRIVAHDKKESILSLSVKIFGAPKIVEIVKKTMFTPAPSVDSAVIYIDNISNNILTTHKITNSMYFEVIKKAFGQKRKQLLGNLKGYNKTEALKTFLQEKNLSETIRAEDIPYSLWVEIVKIIFK
jgi:16S rRNA (adenine1518-N6/adenine1519-N6)-dimethyltransferase